MPHTLSIIPCLFLALVAAAGTPEAGTKLLKLSRHRVVAAKFVQIRRLAYQVSVKEYRFHQFPSFARISSP